ncbi:MAG: hypothetical protein Q9187_006788 [Circinaria calcarea]
MHNPRFKFFVSAIGVATVAILIRSVYRIPELSGGWANPIMRDEIDFIVLDGVMCAIATLFLTVFHPGYCFKPMQNLRPTMRRNKTLSEKQARSTSESDVEAGGVSYFQRNTFALFPLLILHLRPIPADILSPHILLGQAQQLKLQISSRKLFPLRVSWPLPVPPVVQAEQRPLGELPLHRPALRRVANLSQAKRKHVIRTSLGRCRQLSPPFRIRLRSGTNGNPSRGPIHTRMDKHRVSAGRSGLPRPRRRR